MSRGGPDLDAARIRELFNELSARLAERGESAQLFVVGGAAMALAYDAKRSTRDIDAAFIPTDAVRELAALIGAEHGLDPDWVNDAAKGFMPGADAGARTVFESDNLLVQVASPEYLLAMKVHSGRDERDFDDAALLYRIAGYTSADQVIDLLERTYPARLLLPRHQYIADDIAQRAARLDRTRRLLDIVTPPRTAARTSPSETQFRPEPPSRQRGLTL